MYALSFKIFLPKLFDGQIALSIFPHNEYYDKIRHSYLSLMRSYSFLKFPRFQEQTLTQYWHDNNNIRTDMWNMYQQIQWHPKQKTGPNTTRYQVECLCLVNMDTGRISYWRCVLKRHTRRCSLGDSTKIFRLSCGFDHQLDGKIRVSF